MPILRSNKTGEVKLVCDVCGRRIKAQIETNRNGARRLIEADPKSWHVLGIRVRVGEDYLDAAEQVLAYAVASPYVCSKKCMLKCYFEPESMKYGPSDWSFRDVSAENTRKILFHPDGSACEISTTN